MLSRFKPFLFPKHLFPPYVSLTAIAVLDDSTSLLDGPTSWTSFHLMEKLSTRKKGLRFTYRPQNKTIYASKTISRHRPFSLTLDQMISQWCNRLPLLLQFCASVWAGGNWEVISFRAPWLGRYQGWVSHWGSWVKNIGSVFWLCHRLDRNWQLREKKHDWGGSVGSTLPQSVSTIIQGK